MDNMDTTETTTENLMEENQLPETPVETPSEETVLEAADTSLEEWELNPAYPADEDLLYPGQEMLELKADFLDDEKQEDSLWQARTGLNFDSLCGAIETIIFMSDKPVPIMKIKSIIDEDMPLRVIHQSLMRLQEEYESRHHGLRLVEVAEGYQYRTKATYSKYVQDLFKVNSLVLSPTALEVLAIVAYKQPVAKTEVDKIRGVDSGHIVRGLMDKRLVRVVGRSDEMGRPVLYGTTPEFLEVFNLANIDELPPEHELDDAITNNVGKISDIKTIVHDGDKAQFVFDDMEELEDLASSIKDIASDTDFTNALKNQEKNKLKAVQSETQGEEVEEVIDAEGPRTAFDILEEYVSRQLIINVNNESLSSEMMSMSADPIVISDLTAGPFNVPEEIEEDEDDFQMIDLDTGLPIEDFDDVEFDIEVELSDDSETDDEDEEEDFQFDAEGLFEEDSEENAEENDKENDKEENEMYLQGEDLIGNGDDEAAELARALDNAFEKLTGERLEEVDSEVLEELNLRESNINDKEEDLDALVKDISEKARDLDIDLDFLNDQPLD